MTQEITSHRAVRVPDYNDNIRIDVGDEPDQRGANHLYKLSVRIPQVGTLDKLTEIKFQKGPLIEVLPNGTWRENAPNGLTVESLLAILIHRIEGLQRSSETACPENVMTLEKLKAVLHFQRQRIKRGEYPE
jgi:hypothetical protein